MKLTVLVDNNTIIDQYFLGEPGVSFYIEDDTCRVLFDAGYSDVFLRNAVKLKIDLTRLDAVVLSHGHNDHTWGLSELLKLYSEAGSPQGRRGALIAHPGVFEPKFHETAPIGAMLAPEQFSPYLDLRLTDQPLWLTDRLVFLGQIERGNTFENKRPVGKRGDGTPDYLLDDSALAFKAKDGLVIITGCSHAGICNIIEQAKRVCGDNRVVDIIGGFHLLKPSPEQLGGTMEYLRALGVPRIHACHCTDFAAKHRLAEVVELAEVGSGLTLTYE